jgi:hypothetical protein
MLWVGAAAMAGVLLGCGLRDLTFTITFDSARGLKPGDAVLYNGMDIGAIQALEQTSSGQVAAQIRVRTRYRHLVRRGCRYRIGKAWPDRTGRRWIEVEECDETSAAVARNDIIRGTESWTDALRVGLGSLTESLQEIARSPEARALVDRAQEAADRGLEYAREKAPELKREMEQAYEALMEAGRSEEAKQLRRAFEEWLRSLDQ